MSSLTCHQPDNTNSHQIYTPITTYTNNNSVIPTTPQQCLQTKNLSLEVQGCGLYFLKTLMQ